LSYGGWSAGANKYPVALSGFGQIYTFGGINLTGPAATQINAITIQQG
jgi:hypothetical protein